MFTIWNENPGGSTPFSWNVWTSCQGTTWSKGCATNVKHSLKTIEAMISFLNHKDIAHVAMQGTSEPHDMLPGTEGDSDNQKVPPSRSSTFI